ncbi:UNVERIFIED_CONTAM: Lon protease2, peroxisomal [Sesamum angustifolium]|uniref:Lon protease2, peroxisomal n=1 Tax=Sesamum angustifolium TaxID=2727405 RepID=A0AAW2M553_9LAMI
MRSSKSRRKHARDSHKTYVGGVVRARALLPVKESGRNPSGRKAHAYIDSFELQKPSGAGCGCKYFTVVQRLMRVRGGTNLHRRLLVIPFNDMDASTYGGRFRKKSPNALKYSAAISGAGGLCLNSVSSRLHPSSVHLAARAVEQIEMQPVCGGQISRFVRRVLELEMDQVEQDPDFTALSRQFKATAMELISVLEQVAFEEEGLKFCWRQFLFTNWLIFFASFEISFEEQISMLDSVDVKVRLSKATELVDRHLQSIRVAEKITQKVEGQLSKSQKEFLLRQQMRAIKEELGDNDDDEDDVAALERKMQDAGMPANIWKHAQRELRRLKKMQPQQPGYNSSRVYLELLADLPWQKASEERELDLKAAKERLDIDHYGLVKVKQRIIEYLAVRKLKPDARGPVLCFVGPPGVGKTSLASSIATALGRKFIRISLGGVKDEADIRGHRRTYIGSMPGRLIDGLKRVGVCNPVMLLDEIDKTGSDVRVIQLRRYLKSLILNRTKPLMINGCVLLENKGEQVESVSYLNVPFDLSKVIFVATANRVQPIPPPLLDRMEVIELPGYTPEEKLRIAMRHLIPRVLDQHGLSFDFLQVPEAMVKLVIQRYTREAGVRNLERNLAALARAAAVRVAEQDQAVPLSKDVQRLASPLLDGRLADEAEVEMEVIPISVNNHDISNAFRVTSPYIVDEAMLEKVLGVTPRYDRETADRVATPGVSVGLVWTAFGGEVQFVEATAMVGKGDLHLTGQLGDVIKESAQIALTWVRARATELKLATVEESNLLEGRDIHIHFPAGAVPKDGPSAGVTLVTALVSLFSHRRVRADTAMTGEMTLRGLVLPVGGIKDKVLAAHRYGIKRVILPERNLKDLVEVPSAVLSSLETEILLMYQLTKARNCIVRYYLQSGWRTCWTRHSRVVVLGDNIRNYEYPRGAVQLDKHLKIAN